MFKNLNVTSSVAIQPVRNSFFSIFHQLQAAIVKIHFARRELCHSVQRTVITVY